MEGKATSAAVAVWLRAGEDVLEDEVKQSFLQSGIRGVEQRSTY